MNVNEIVATLEEIVVRVNALEKKFAAFQTSASSAEQAAVQATASTAKHVTVRTGIASSADGKTQK